MIERSAPFGTACVKQRSPSASWLQGHAGCMREQCQTNHRLRLLLLFSTLEELIEYAADPANTGESCYGGGDPPQGVSSLGSGRSLRSIVILEWIIQAIQATWDTPAHLWLSGLSVEHCKKKLPQTQAVLAGKWVE